MLKDDDWEVRVCTLAALVDIGEGSKVDVDSIASLLEDDVYHVRVGACGVLGVLKAADKADQVSDVLDDNCPSVRAAALIALGSLGEDAADHANRIYKRLSD